MYCKLLLGNCAKEKTLFKKDEFFPFSMSILCIHLEGKEDKNEKNI